MTPNARTGLLVGLVAAMLLAACSGPPLQTRDRESSADFTSGPSARPLQPVPTDRPNWGLAPPSGHGIERYTSQQIAWVACGAYQCADVLVPMDYEQPDAWAIQLSLSRRPSTASKPHGTLFLNPGGPGIPGTEALASAEDPALDGFHLIGWDPRGTEGSAPVSCPGLDVSALVSTDRSPDTEAEDRAWLEVNRAFGAACLKGTGSLLEHVSTEETVRDLELLRHVVGASELNYLGSSYGSLIGALYAELYPKRVGRMVLDGAMPLRPEPAVGWVSGFESVLEEFASWCADRGEQCRLGTSPKAVLATIRDLLRDLDAKPLDAGMAKLTQADALDAIMNALYSDQSTWLELQGALEAAVVDGNGIQLLGLADSPFRTDQQLVSSAWAIMCLDQAGPDLPGARKAARDDARQSPTLGPSYGLDATCPLWPVAPRELTEIDGSGAGPILVIGTTHDPATSYQNAVRMSEQLESATLLTFDGYGHLALGQSACAWDLAVEFLITGKAPPEGTRC